MTKPTTISSGQTKIPYERPRVTKKRPLVRATLFSGGATSSAGSIATVITP